MNLDEISKAIKELTVDINEDNAQSMAVKLVYIGRLIKEQWANTSLKNYLIEFSSNLKSDIIEIQKSIDLLNEEFEKYSSIIKQKEEIEKKFILLKEDEEKLGTLKEKSEAINNLSQIQKEISEVSLVNSSIMANHCEIAQKINDVLSPAITDLEVNYKESINSVAKNLYSIQAKQLEVLNKLDMRELVFAENEFAKEVEDLKKEYNTYVERVNNNRETQEGIINLFKEHHIENEHILSALKKRNEALNDLENKNQEIKKMLEDYDREVKHIIEKRDHLPIYQLEETKNYQ